MMKEKDVPLLPGFEISDFAGQRVQRKNGIEFNFAGKVFLYFHDNFICSAATLHECAKQARMRALDEIDYWQRFAEEMDAILAAEEKGKAAINGN